MTDFETLPDYATMRRAIRRVHEAGRHVDVPCPSPGCRGRLQRRGSSLVCGNCGRDPT